MRTRPPVSMYLQAFSMSVAIDFPRQVFVTLADGTQNSLADSSPAGADAAGDVLGAALYSAADLTLRGTGALSVAGSCNDGIKSKDDLVIIGGTYTVSSVGDALVGKDCVKIGGGSFTLMSGKDGVASSNEDDADRGFVSIDGGSFSIDADDDGVHAECGLSVSGGTVDVVSSIEGLEGQSISVSGGEVSIVSSDDGIVAGA